MAYDLDLFRRLNAEYATRTIVDLARLAARTKALSPPLGTSISYDDRVRAAAKRQLGPVRRDVALADKTVLELGCGHGYFTAALVRMAGAAHVIGVDIELRPNWNEHRDPNVTFVEADISAAPVIPPDSVDVVVSNAVFEHVRRPLQTLAVLYEVLRVGGTAWLTFNLYRGRNASHRYRQVFFPWPHLLFDDEVCRAFYRESTGEERSFGWVNKLTAAEYVAAVRGLGFRIDRVRRMSQPIDLPFYCRFVDKLGHYPALDLETNFLTLVLTKPTSPPALVPAAIPELDYVARQRALDDAIVRHILETAK